MRWLADLASVLRGAASRGATTVMTLIVALVAVAAATAGPTYYAASQASILQDTVQSAPALGRGIEVVQTGSVSGTLDPFASSVSASLDGALGGGDVAARLFQTPVEAIEGTTVEPVYSKDVILAWRSGVCGHLVMTGACPKAAGQVLVSRSLAAVDRWRIGEKVRVPTFGTVTVTGIYVPPGLSGDYWLDRGTTYFPYEFPPAISDKPPPNEADAMFTVRSTLENAPSSVQGTDVFDDVLAANRLQAADVGRLSAAMVAMNDNAQLQAEQAIVTSQVPATMASVQSGWSSLAVPTLLISVELLILAWLLLFLLVTEAVEGRGGDLALAKMRGHGRVRILTFGLSEPTAVLALAFPLGVLVGWGATILLARALLRPGTPVALPAPSWAAAAAAAAGGLAAVVLASQRTLRRPVIEQWRRANRKATRRGWVLDAILLTGAAAGLAELFLSGRISSAHHSGLSLLVPGLLGLAVAVVASRLLPVMCRAVMGRCRGLGAYLALRQVARRPEGMRTTIMLAMSFALATFAVAAWSVGQGNYQAVARAQAGAPTVLTVSTRAGQDLGAVVDRADPTGGRAAAVEVYDTNGADTLAVDPTRFARVASWGAGSPMRSPGALTAALDPPTPAPLILAGDAVRMTLTANSLSPPGNTLDLVVDEAGAGAGGPTPVEVGSIPASGTMTLTAALVGCPCLVQELDVVIDPQLASSSQSVASGKLTLRQLQVHLHGDWNNVSDGFGDVSHWRSGNADAPSLAVATTPGGLQWTYREKGQDPLLQSVNRPAALPALAAAAVTGDKRGAFTTVGLDGNNLAVNVVATSPTIPGAAASGVVVDRRFAERAADGNLDLAIQQVWVRDGLAAVESRLRAQGVNIESVQKESGITSMLSRQGPGLASVLFIAEAGAAALLAAGGAVLGIYLSGRRRRYEYAALEATGLRRRTLLAALLGEQMIVLGFGALVGIGTGIAAVAAVLRDVPEFVTEPTAPSLSFVPPEGHMVVILGVIVGVALLGMVLASIALIRSVRLDQLREAPA